MASWPETTSLAALGVLTGLAMLWVVRRFSDQAAIRHARHRLWASLYEFRLFADEPALIWRAQKQLLYWNGRYLAHMLRPALVMLLPMIVLLVQLDAVYGRRPLRAGESAIVTVQLREDVDVAALAPVLEAPPGIAIETPPVRMVTERQVCWRVGAGSEVSGRLRVRLGSASVDKRIVAGNSLRYTCGRRVASWLDQIWLACESPLPAGPVEWIDIAYPPADLRVAGINCHWLVWFFLISLATAFLLRKRFRVTL